MASSLNRLTQIKQSGTGVSGNHAVAEKRADFAYDLAGQMQTVQRYASLDTSSAVALTEYACDKAGRLDTLKHHQGATTGGTLLAGYDYTFNNRNQLDAIDFLPDGVNSVFDYSSEDVDYAYDYRGQLKTADQSGTTHDESYWYDNNANRVTANGSNYETGANNQLLSDGTYAYEYDGEGNRTKRTEIATGDYTEYEWDHRNRLVRVTDRNAAGTITQQVEHAYDAFDQWIRRTVDTDGETGSAPLEQTVFIHDDNQIVLEFADSGSTDLTEADLTHRYLWSGAVDQLLANEQVDDLFNPANNETLWALTDYKGTIRDLADDSGSVVNHIQYDSVGAVTAESNATQSALFKYNGKALDATSGNYWMRARWYDPTTSRWLSEDFVWDGTNKYAFVGNQVTTYVDYDGLQRVWGVGGAKEVFGDMFGAFFEWFGFGETETYQSNRRRIDRGGSTQIRIVTPPDGGMSGVMGGVAETVTFRQCDEWHCRNSIGAQFGL